MHVGFGSNMPPANNVRISASVRRKGVNRRDDLSNSSAAYQRSSSDAATSARRRWAVRVADDRKIGAIEEIQSRYLHINPTDGREDPHGATFRVLVRTGGTRSNLNSQSLGYLLELLLEVPVYPQSLLKSCDCRVDGGIFQTAGEFSHFSQA
jgi:hypothetical protein